MDINSDLLSENVEAYVGFFCVTVQAKTLNLVFKPGSAEKKLVIGIFYMKDLLQIYGQQRLA